MDVTSLDRDETHDMQVTFDHDAGLMRLLITVSDSRAPAAGSLASCQQLRRPADHRTAVVKYNVRSVITAYVHRRFVVFSVRKKTWI